MSESKDKKPSSTIGSIVKKSYAAADLSMISEAIADLNLTRKSVQLYPINHHQVKQSATKAYEQLKAIFFESSEVSIGVASSQLVVAKEILDPKNPACKEIAQSLAAHDIIVLTLFKGLTPEELASFFAILAQKPDKIKQEGGLNTCLKKYAIKHIKIKLVDYQKLSITDESEILRDQEVDSASVPTNNIWQGFATQLLETQEKENVSNIQPLYVAQLLNQKPAKANEMLQKYEQLIRSQLQKNDQEQSSLKNRETIVEIKDLLEALNPNLRHQFLTSTLNQCNQAAEADQTRTFISQLSYDLVADMLHQANQKESRISESLMNLIQKISRTISQEKTVSPQSTSPEIPTGRKEPLQELFNRENYDDFVAEEYDQTLRHLAQHRGEKSSDLVPNKMEDIIKEELNSSQLNRHILRALNGLMIQSENPTEFKTYSAKIIEIAKENLEKNRFDILLEAIGILRNHCTDASSPEIIHEAKAALDQIITPDMSHNLIEILNQNPENLPQHLGSLLQMLGPQVVPELVSRYLQGGTGEKQQTILSILKNYKKESVDAANQIIQHDDVDKIKKMIFLIRQIDHRASSAYLRSLVAHTDPNISREALAALLYFDDPWGEFFLKDRLNSENPNEVFQAIAMAGNYKIKAMLPDLAARLKFAALSKADIKRNTELIQAMAKIGDSAAIPFLIKIVNNSWSFHRSNLRELKTDVFKTLRYYPANEIAPLVKIGRKTKDKTIVQICDQLSALDETPSPE